MSPLPLLCHHYRQSYYVDIQVSIGNGPNKRNSCNVVDLKNHYLRFANVAAAPPPQGCKDNQTDQLLSNNGGAQVNRVSWLCHVQELDIDIQILCVYNLYSYTYTYCVLYCNFRGNKIRIFHLYRFQKNIFENGTGLNSLKIHQ